MKRLCKYLSEKQCAAICTATIMIMFGVETAAVHFFEKDTLLFNILMGIVIACPFVFTFFLQGAWRESEAVRGMRADDVPAFVLQKNIDNRCNK